MSLDCPSCGCPEWAWKDDGKALRHLQSTNANLLEALEEARNAINNMGAELYREEADERNWSEIVSSWPTVQRIDAAIAQARKR